MTELPKNLPPKTACVYLEQKHGVRRKPSTLAVYRSKGGGPRFCRDGRNILYPVPELDKYAEEQLTEPVATTAELTAALAEDAEAEDAQAEKAEAGEDETEEAQGEAA